MAEKFPDPTETLDSVETRINLIINRLIDLLNVRRIQLIDKFHNIREERKVTETARLQMVKQITEAHASLQDQLKANPLPS